MHCKAVHMVRGLMKTEVSETDAGQKPRWKTLDPYCSLAFIAETHIMETLRLNS
jgi:hypothetical protein